jgi:hypothetical protein
VARTAASSTVDATTSGTPTAARRIRAAPSGSSSKARAIGPAVSTPAPATARERPNVGSTASGSSRAASPCGPSLRRGIAHIRPVSAPKQQIAPAMVTRPMTLNSAPEPSAPKARTMTVVSTKPNAPLTAAPTSPTAPLRVLRRTSVSAGPGAATVVMPALPSRCG